MASRTATRKDSLGFGGSKRFFANLDPAAVARLVEAGADIALILEDGRVLDIAVSSEEVSVDIVGADWRGSAFVDVVTPESRPKVEAMLGAGLGDGRWRQLSHPTATGFDMPVNYTSVPIGKGPLVLAIGREMRSVATLQQRLVRTHQELEREYDRLRHAEARYRDLFDAMSEPVVVLDADAFEVREANPAARLLLDLPESGEGAVFSDCFSKDASRSLNRFLERALANGQADLARVRVKRKGDWSLRASAFRHDDAVSLIVRMQGGDPAHLHQDGESEAHLRSVIEHLPDAVVVTASNLRIMSVNATFLRMIHLVDERRAVGDELENWLGRSSTELNMLMSNLKNYGVVRNFATVIKDRFGADEEVEVSAVAAPVGDETVYGFSIRNTSRRLQSRPQLGAELPNSVDQVTNLVGRLPLKEIVRESTDLIERLCIDAALEIADDNRASAAEILGLSRQGLYSKLKRFGFDD